MATNRTRRRRGRQLTQLTPPVHWWLEHGGSLSHEESARLGMTDQAAVLQVWVLNGCDETFSRARPPLWSRIMLRAAGYGDAIDALIAAGKAPADDAFTRRPTDGY